jgi:thioredoxin reductase
MKHDCCVIGAGPAGIAAAIQLKRFGLSPVMIERDRIGGLLHAANLVENYPGFPGGIAGPELAARFERQLRAEAVEVLFDEVTALSVSGSDCFIHTECNRDLRGPAVIATGTEPVRDSGLTIPAALASYIGYEITPVADVQDWHVVIVGGGDAALDYASRLGRNNRVTICSRGLQSSALPLLRYRVRQMTTVDYRSQATVVSVESGQTGSLCLTCIISGSPQKIECDYLLFAIGRRPCTGYMENVAILSSPEGEEAPFYLVGDVCNGRYRQTAIAVGDGLRVAMRLCERFSDRTVSYQENQCR